MWGCCYWLLPGRGWAAAERPASRKPCDEECLALSVRRAEGNSPAPHMPLPAHVPARTSPYTSASRRERACASGGLEDPCAAGVNALGRRHRSVETLGAVSLLKGWVVFSVTSVFTVDTCGSIASGAKQSARPWETQTWGLGFRGLTGGLLPACRPPLRAGLHLGGSRPASLSSCSLKPPRTPGQLLRSNSHSRSHLALPPPKLLSLLLGSASPSSLSPVPAFGTVTAWSKDPSTPSWAPPLHGVSPPCLVDSVWPVGLALSQVLVS